MDILYLVGEGYSKCNYNELRYSLRSIEKYGKNVDRVYVVGYCPEWLSDEIIKIPLDSQSLKHSGITEKHINFITSILYVVDNTDIGNEFLISMDDHFYIRETDFNNYPIYAKIVGGDTQLDTKKNPPNNYGKFILKTKELLKSLNLPTYFFTLHRNMHVFKDTIKQCRDILDNIVKNKLDCEPMAFLLNYRYKQTQFSFIPVKDIKIKSENNWEKVNPDITEVFSTYDFESDSKLDTLIQNLFPDKSKYEKS